MSEKEMNESASVSRPREDACSMSPYSVEYIKAWRKRECDAGRPCRLSDYFNAHGIPHSDPNNQPMIKSNAPGQPRRDETLG
jgi:hypothetical protein